jgi:hypothetical protein
VLIIDDSIEEKPYTDENDIVCWHYDHSKDRMLKGINFLTALCSSQGVSVPVSLHLVAKTEKYTDPKTQKEKRRRSVAKHAVGQELSKQAVTNLIPFRFVLFDVWLPRQKPWSSSNSSNSATLSVPSRPIVRSP